MPQKQQKRTMSEGDKHRLVQNASDTDSSEEETADGVFSASECKLFAGLFQDASDHTTAVQDSSGFRLVHYQSIAKSITEADVCRLCKKGKLILEESLKSRQGFHVPMKLCLLLVQRKHNSAYPYTTREESP